MSLQTIQIINTGLYWMECNPDYPESETMREKLVEDMTANRNRDIKYLGDDFPCSNGGHLFARNANGHWICTQCHYHSILHDHTTKG